MHFSNYLSLLVLGATVSIAHPGHDIRQEIEERAAFLKTMPRDLSHCAEQMKQMGLEARAAARRAAIARDARIERRIATDAPYVVARDAGTVLKTSHLSPVSYNAATAESILFAGMSTCVLSPEVTQGPYYVGGEYVRRDVRDGQKGVDLILDTQVIDMATCKPVTTAMVEIWHCNSTGVYGGIIMSGNGNQNDKSNADNTMLRGLQQTDSDGVAQFLTIFPGHYTGRAIHIHTMVHLNGDTLANGTFGGTTAAHVGQLFFDQSLISQVELTSPYSTNTQKLTQNSADGIFSQEASTSDPVVHYSLLGSSVSDGIFGWVAFGINVSNNFKITPAAKLTKAITSTRAA